MFIVLQRILILQLLFYLVSKFVYSYGKRIWIRLTWNFDDRWHDSWEAAIKFPVTTCIFKHCELSINWSYDKDIFSLRITESNSLQADIGKLHTIASNLLVPVGEVILTSCLVLWQFMINCQSTRQLYQSVNRSTLALPYPPILPNSFEFLCPLFFMLVCKYPWWRN